MATLSSEGLMLLAKRITGVDSVAAIDVVQLGTGTSSEAYGSTALGTPVVTSGLGKSTATCTYQSTAIHQWSKTWTSTQTVTLYEFAILTSSSALLARHVWGAPGKSLESGDALAITASLQEARST